MRYLLDTNIISDIAKPAPSDSLLAWMSEQNDEDLFIASLTVAEIRRGVLESRLANAAISLMHGSLGRRGRRRSSLAAYWPSTKMPA